MTVLIIILISAVFSFILYKYFKSKSERRISTTKANIRKGKASVTGTSTVHQGDGYASDGTPVKLSHESQENFNRREAEWYYASRRK
tara:strand:+ start:418 stop:678 length:261 start_codon:yes stop_codon:yes gene_type:complete